MLSKLKMAAFIVVFAGCLIFAGLSADITIRHLEQPSLLEGWYEIARMQGQMLDHFTEMNFLVEEVIGLSQDQTDAALRITKDPKLRGELNEAKVVHEDLMETSERVDRLLTRTEAITDRYLLALDNQELPNGIKIELYALAYGPLIVACILCLVVGRKLGLANADKYLKRKKEKWLSRVRQRNQRLQEMQREAESNLMVSEEAVEARVQAMLDKRNAILEQKEQLLSDQRSALSEERQQLQRDLVALRRESLEAQETFQAAARDRSFGEQQLQQAEDARVKTEAWGRRIEAGVLFLSGKLAELDPEETCSDLSEIVLGLNEALEVKAV